MADYRSKSYNSGVMQIEHYHATPARRNDQFKSTWASSSTTYYCYADPSVVGPPKWKSTNPSDMRSWSAMRDPEFLRKKRVATYKAYSLEGKVKGSFRKSFRWFKDRYTQVMYGWW